MNLSLAQGLVHVPFSLFTMMSTIEIWRNSTVSIVDLPPASKNLMGTMLVNFLPVRNGEPLWSLRVSLTVAHSNRNDKTPIIITIIVIKYNDNYDDDDDNDDNTLYCKFDLHWKLWLAERIQSIYKIVWSNRITQYLQHILHLSTRVQSLPGFQAP